MIVVVSLQLEWTCLILGHETRITYKIYRMPESYI